MQAVGPSILQLGLTKKGEAVSEVGAGMLSPRDSWWTTGNEACVSFLEHSPRPPLGAGLRAGSVSTNSLRKGSSWPFTEGRCTQVVSIHGAMKRNAMEISRLPGNMERVCLHGDYMEV